MPTMEVTAMLVIGDSIWFSASLTLASTPLSARLTTIAYMTT